MIKKQILKLLNSFGYELRKKGVSSQPQNKFKNESWSQEGEDLILARYLNKRDGIYVDVGAHHPYRYSNTYRLYKIRGWKGVNIDALPGTKKLFDKERPRDTNLEVAISSKEDTLKYYMFEIPELNTFSEEQAKQHNKKWKIKEIKELPVLPLREALKPYEHILKGNVDLMSIDVEGYEMEVLISNDWNKYKPNIILIENLSKEDKSVDDYLIDLGYVKFANTINTYFYRLKEIRKSI